MNATWLSILPRKTVWLAVLLAAVGFSPAAAEGLGSRMAAAEQAVHRLPMEYRPNRLGHVYGNNVRRLHFGRVCVNCGREERPVLRFFYLP